MRIFELTQGKYTQVSDEDFDWLTQWSWHADQCHGIWFAVRTIYLPGPPRKWNKVRMHNAVAERAGIALPVDHKDRDELNNQRGNLRTCTDSQNAANRRRFKNNTSGFKGVHFRKDLGKWRACIYVNKKMKPLGYYDTAEEAARAYDKAATEFFGEFACLNFP